MKKPISILMLFSSFLLVTTGCWDNVELNEQAIMLAIAMDLEEDGTYQVSAQFVIPSKLGSAEAGGGEQGENFFVETGRGKNVYDAIKNMQPKLSRTIFRGHRQSIYIGERLAKHGMKDILDMITRDADVRMRSDISVIKGNQAMEALKITYPFETTSALASIKIHDQFDKAANTAFLDLVIASNSKSTSPSIPAWELVSESASQGGEAKKEKRMQAAGSAVFNRELQLVGFLDEVERKDKMWIVGNLSNETITVYIPQGHGQVSLDIRDLKSKVHPVLQGNRIKMNVELSGEGEVRQNNTTFDLMKPHQVEVLEAQLEDYCKNRVSQLIQKVQKKYGADIFGFGDTIFRRYPSRGEEMVSKWETEFAQLDVSVNVDLTIRLIGLTGPSD
ncbi:Ger(x)C family spore germination protein [Ammoniphilus sp. 3BR4]|uniref:Ger(x)C family spore germination protein n=1 Tax=Ammoniphilus sp. 3BR4 TaxID=3158265 RepID=UPI003467CE2D